MPYDNSTDNKTDSKKYNDSQNWEDKASPDYDRSYNEKDGPVAQNNSTTEDSNST